MKDATIYDVAKRAGVSHQTVSRFLRGFEGIRPTTREKVEQALAELEYRPNSAARYLRLQRTNRIGLLADNMHQSGPARTIAGATEAARSLGYVTDIVSMDGGDERSVDDALDLMLGQQIAGIVVTAQTAVARSALERRAISVPVARDFGLMVEGTTESINEHAGRVAAEHLVGLGHRRVAYVAGPDQWLAARERADGFRQAVTGSGGAVTVTDVGDWSAAAGYDIGLRLAARTDDFTAIAVANDAMAMGLLAALAAEGVSVPHEVSVVGNDDTPEARFMVPSLSTVALDFGFEGAHVMTSLIAHIEGRSPDTASRLPVPSLVARASTAPARG
ncbi:MULTISPECIES: LacI family DNA-binding transcriptional regulator [unclassified Frigoribacterium]|uniref:LacI family DNA-binding transcriptional regulator n=1 Tax=unclassified Frigoribacterium TaxID=2627005 RepID=UPI0015660E96|nr:MULTISPECIES: LacI family DNA-binding transcriptional regulator [unclassified Frigoribacterium]NQW87753.1 LacI family DNA-binding transcriptional regulator [Frigoribacterium sp. VKM Ac-2860]NQX09438.1 LacI family DNA-binding transcriptional regulator [Frigoribacterium sp. VKM Ac-2859]